MTGNSSRFRKCPACAVVRPAVAFLVIPGRYFGRRCPQCGHEGQITEFKTPRPARGQAGIRAARAKGGAS